MDNLELLKPINQCQLTGIEKRLRPVVIDKSRSVFVQVYKDCFNGVRLVLYKELTPLAGYQVKRTGTASAATLGHHGAIKDLEKIYKNLFTSF